MNKFVILTIIVVVAACNAQDRAPRPDEMKKYIDECKVQTSATDADVMAFIARQPFANKSGWCLMACIKKKIGILTAANKMDMEKVKAKLQEMMPQNPDMYKKMLSIMQQCSDQLDSDPKNSADQCTAAQVFGSCYYSKKAAAGLP